MRKLVLLVSAGVLAGCGLQKDLDAITYNNRGVESLKNENTVQAQHEFVEGLARKPFDSTLHNNLGVALDANKEIEKALKSYETGHEQAREGRSQFVSRFNIAQAHAKQGKIDLALEWYQKALENDPTSKEVKTNIELLTSQKQQQQGGGQGQGQDNQDQKDKDQKQSESDQQKKDKDRSQGYQQSQKYKPRPFQGDLSESDVKKILGELKQQEQRIRADYNRKEAKEAPRDKDW